MTSWRTGAGYDPGLGTIGPNSKENTKIHQAVSEVQDIVQLVQIWFKMPIFWMVGSHPHQYVQILGHGMDNVRVGVIEAAPWQLEFERGRIAWGCLGHIEIT